MAGFADVSLRSMVRDRYVLAASYALWRNKCFCNGTPVLSLSMNFLAEMAAVLEAVAVSLGLGEREEIVFQGRKRLNEDPSE